MTNWIGCSPQYFTSSSSSICTSLSLPTSILLHSFFFLFFRPTNSKPNRDHTAHYSLVSFCSKTKQTQMAINRDSTPPPKIGKIGPYTVFMTPPSTPKPLEEEHQQQQQQQQQPVFESPKKVVLPPVQPPPQQFVKPVAADGSAVGFFKNAVTKMQNAHSSLDDHLARWFGLNQSKYQWALDDYYENKGLGKGNSKAQDVPSKMQSV